MPKLNIIRYLFLFIVTPVFAQQNLYSNNEYSIELPDDWCVEESHVDNGDDETGIIIREDIEEYMVKCGLRILGEGAEVNELMPEKIIEEITKNYSESIDKLLEVSTKEVGNIIGALYVVEDKSTIIFMNLEIINKGYIYYLQCWDDADRFVANRNLYESIVNSFVFHSEEIEKMTHELSEGNPICGK
jgi:hypothetical protein